MKLWVVAALLAACGNEKSAPKEHPGPRPATTIDAAPPDAFDAIAALKLPPMGIADVDAVLWKPSSEVEKALGRGEKRLDAKWRHELAGGGFVVVTYDRERAVAIEVPIATSGFEAMTDAQKDYVAAWFGLEKKQNRVNGRQLWYGDAFSGTGLGLYEFEYIKRLEAQLERETAKNAKAAAEREAREERELAAKLLAGRVHLARLSEEMRKSGAGASFEVGDTPTDVWYVGGICTQDILNDLAARMRASFSSFGFRKMRCLDLSASL